MCNEKYPDNFWTPELSGRFLTTFLGLHWTSDRTQHEKCLSLTSLEAMGRWAHRLWSFSDGSTQCELYEFWMSEQAWPDHMQDSWKYIRLWKLSIIGYPPAWMKMVAHSSTLNKRIRCITSIRKNIPFSSAWRPRGVRGTQQITLSALSVNPLSVPRGQAKETDKSPPPLALSELHPVAFIYNHFPCVDKQNHSSGSVGSKES